jgi:uridine kinase
MRLSLDDFYRDRSHLSAGRRNKINFDHPRAIDWRTAEKVIGTLAKGVPIQSPKYDFATHSRSKKTHLLRPKPLIVVDGLWVLRRRSLRRHFACGIFVDAPRTICFQRRLTRDLEERGRRAADVRRQFFRHVVPMHEKFVRPQTRWADFVLRSTNPGELESLATHLKTILKKAYD